MACILVIDDEPDVRRVLTRLFEREGHTVFEAANGVEALKLTHSETFDLVLVDMVMDKMDGVDTIAVLRNEVTSPVVAVSAHLTEDLVEELEKLGVAGFLQKPFSASDVKDLSQRLIPP